MSIYFPSMAHLCLKGPLRINFLLMVIGLSDIFHLILKGTFGISWVALTIIVAYRNYHRYDYHNHQISHHHHPLSVTDMAIQVNVARDLNYCQYKLTLLFFQQPIIKSSSHNHPQLTFN